MGRRGRALLLVMLLAVGMASTRATAEEEPTGSPAPDGAPTVTVLLRDNRFHPARVTVAVGTTVLWSNAEDDPTVEHNVISRDYRWASSNFVAGETYEHTFTPPGNYRYFCDLHGGMTGMVVVE